MSEEMGLIERIDALQDRLNGKEPAWIRGYSDEHRTSHLSGALREAITDIWGHRTGVASEVLNVEELALTSLLEDAAESLDVAHEEWLNTQLAARDLVGDIGALNCDDPRDDDMQEEHPTGRHWYGGFHPSYDDDSCIETQCYIEWPNLSITAEQLAAVLRGEEYKL